MFLHQRILRKSYIYLSWIINETINKIYIWSSSFFKQRSQTDVSGCQKQQKTTVRESVSFNTKNKEPYGSSFLSYVFLMQTTLGVFPPWLVISN